MPAVMPIGSHPPGCYYVNVITHTIQRQCNPLLATSLAALGYVGNDGTPAVATNAFPTFQEAQNYANQVAKGFKSVAGHVPLLGPLSGGNPLAPGNISNPLGGVAAIGDFFNRLTQPNTWIRVGEVIGGLLLVYVGLRATTSGTEAAEIGRGVKSAAKPVKAVAKATPAGRGLAVERRARKIAKRRSIESAAGRRATVIKQKKAS